MQLFIFKTNIASKKKANELRPSLDKINSIKDWNIDLQDIDYVLRIEANDNIQETDIIGLVNENGFMCEALND